ncbi:MAG TPA: hypothetical protein VM511_01070, partial [Luteolibacter sp.]|nr:hypothetical protein [Luteolibacter sp.]
VPARSKDLTEKLAKEKALEAFTFRVAQASFENLVKDRPTLSKKPEAPAQPQGRQGGTFRIPQGGMPPGSPPLEAVTEPVEAVTPPIKEQVLEEIPVNPPAEKKD